jgi:quercetin dioxygenase-like cupin family protein
MPNTAHLVDPSAVEAIEVLGPTIRFLTPPDGPDDGPCVMRGTIPPGVVVPLHSHSDPETFLMHSGAVEGLVDGGRWVPVGPGDVFHVPGDARHAWRNHGREPAVMTLISTNRIGRFFREIAAPVDDPVAHFLSTAQRYGYWNATPEENAAVGLAA